MRHRTLIRGALVALTGMVLLPGVVATGASADSVARDSTARAGVTSSADIVKVQAVFHQPKVDCAQTANARVRIQVVLGRPDFGDQTSIGTEAVCNHGVASYFVFHQWVGDTRERVTDFQPGVRVRLTLWARYGSVLGDWAIYCHGGDYCGGGEYHGPTSDGYSTGALTVHSVLKRGEVQPLADFGTVYFAKALMNDLPVGADGSTWWRMVGSTGNVLAVPSGVHPNGRFAVNWRAAA